jgi:plastocyanin
VTSRRSFLRIAGGGVAVALAGCAALERDGGTATPVRTDEPVAVGPHGAMRFEPAAVEVSVGDVVAWRFESAGHNVSAKPETSGEVSIPDDAAPFASYEGGDHYATAPVGETFEHTFEVAGEYVYVCTPHVARGMVGRVVVTE